MTELSFRVGDKVRIRADLSTRQRHDSGVNSRMLQFAGREVTISQVGIWSYSIYEDWGNFLWNESMFEAPEDNTTCEWFKKVIINGDNLGL